MFKLPWIKFFKTSENNFGIQFRTSRIKELTYTDWCNFERKSGKGASSFVLIYRTDRNAKLHYKWVDRWFLQFTMLMIVKDKNYPKCGDA